MKETDKRLFFFIYHCPETTPPPPSQVESIEDMITINEKTFTLIMKTISFATLKHGSQTRKSTGHPFILHPLEVANYIVKIGGVTSIEVVQAAILHDVLEDTKTSRQELLEEFGPNVLRIVEQVSDDRSLSKSQRKRLQIEHASQISHEAKIVKLADKLHNLRDLIQRPIWDLSISQGYFVWSHAVVKAMKGTNAGLEKALDEVFSSAFPCGEPGLPSRDPKELNQLLEEYLNKM